MVPKVKQREYSNQIKFNFKNMLRLLSYLGKYKFRLVVVIICMIISSISTVALSLFLKSLIDNYITPLLLSPNPDFSNMLNAIVRVGIAVYLGVICTLIFTQTMLRIAHSIFKEIRDNLFARMQYFEIKYFDETKVGDIMSTFSNDVDTLRQIFSEIFPQFLIQGFTIIAITISMLVLSVNLTICVWIFTAIMLFVVKYLSRKSGKFFVKTQSSVAELNGYVEELIKGSKEIKSFCYEEKAIENFDRKNEDWFDNVTNANIYALSVMPAMNALGYMLYIVVAVVGAYCALFNIKNYHLVGIDLFTIGTIISFLTLIKNYTNPIGQLSSQLNSVLLALAGSERIFKLLDQNVEIDDGYVKLIKEDDGKWIWLRHTPGYDEPERIPLEGAIVFDKVDFAYENGKPVLKDIDIYAMPGEKIALVGATGAGKTTISNLINRFYDVEEGKIRYDGININRIKKFDLRNSIGLILQEVHLFSDTVMENIRYGRLDASDEEVIAAAKLANAHSFIEMLKDGYNTVLENAGEGLSQGQRQLISIARAAIANPPVMIMDEATSSIDIRTEKLVQQGMDELMKGRTVFVIAHRLSTIRNATAIMVLDHGRIIERGNHETLMAKQGIYYQLYTGALELD